MNCEEYKQAIAADPAFDNDAGHVSVCADCQAFRTGLQALEKRIARAMRIDVPPLSVPPLPAIETDNVVALSSRAGFRKPAWFALAAGVMLAAVIGVRMIGIDVSYDSLADEVLAHLDHEPVALRVSDRAVSPRRLEKVVPASIGQMNHDAGIITYAQTCKINGKQVPHLVIQGERGPVTILLMPEERVAGATPLEGENIHGVILPVGSGSIAVIGSREENLERIENNVVNSVDWSI